MQQQLSTGELLSGVRGALVGVQVEFNKAALSLSDAIPADGRKAALNRLLKVGLTPCELESHVGCLERRTIVLGFGRRGAARAGENGHCAADTANDMALACSGCACSLGSCAHADQHLPGTIYGGRGIDRVSGVL